MKIYTRRGDGGETGLFGGGRVAKNSTRVEAYGSVDELSAALGVAKAQVVDDGIRDRLSLVQRDLFGIGAHLATPPARPGRRAPEVPALPTDRIGEMEGWIDAATASSPPLRNFVLPGGSAGASQLHVARAVCRRAERRAVALAAEEEVDPAILRYLNRLSDYLFAAARLENRRTGQGDVEWSG